MALTAKARMMRARGRAMTRLVRIHRADFDRLYSEEAAKEGIVPYGRRALKEGAFCKKCGLYTPNPRKWDTGCAWCDERETP